MKYCTGPPTTKIQSSGVLLNWHGCNDHLPLIDYHTEISKVSQVAADRNYYAITPLGRQAPSGAWGWNSDGIPCGKVGVDDFAFFETIVEWIESNLCVDSSKLYTVGFSTGAFMSYGIARRFPHLIAAAGTDAGGLSLPLARGHFHCWHTVVLDRKVTSASSLPSQPLRLRQSASISGCDAQAAVPS